MPTFPTWYTEKTSPVSADMILIADSEASNETKKVRVGNLPIDTGLPTYVVWASIGDFTTIQEAIDAATSWGTIYVTDGTYTLTTQLLLKYPNTRIVGNWQTTVIQANWASVTTLIGYNASGINNCTLENLYIANTNVTTQGIGLNFSNQALCTLRNLYFYNLGTAIKANDTANQTFYNKFEDIKIYECTNGLDFTSTNPINDNAFENLRVALTTWGTGKGLYMNNAQWNTFFNCNFESASGNTWVHLDTVNVINTSFYDVYIEGNTTGVNIASAQRTTFFGWMIVANTTNVTDTWLSTQFIGTNVNYVLKNEMVNLGVIDNSNASAIASYIKNNTTYAHVWGKLASIELLNGSDTSKALEIKNAWSWNSLSVMQGASEVMSVSPAGKITLDATITAWGTTWNRTINKPTGTVNIAAAWTTVTVTNSLVTTSSIVFAVVRTNDSTATIKNVVPWSWSFVINLWAAATAEVSIWFIVYN